MQERLPVAWAALFASSGPAARQAYAQPSRASIRRLSVRTK